MDIAALLTIAFVFGVITANSTTTEQRWFAILVMLCLLVAQLSGVANGGRRGRR